MPTLAASNDNRVSLPLDERLFLGQRLREFRAKAQLTCLEVAEQVLGYEGSHAFVSRLERGALSSIPAEALERLAVHFGLTREELLSPPELAVPASDEVRAGMYRRADVAPGVGQRLRFVRQAASLTHRELADLLKHKNDTWVREWEAESVAPMPDSLMRVAEALGISASWLILGGRVRPTQPTPSLRLRALRHRHELSRRQLAYKVDPQAVGAMFSAIAKLESEPDYRNPLALEKLAKALDVPVDWLACNEGFKLAEQPVVQATAEATAMWEEEQLLNQPQRTQLAMWRALMATGQLDGEDLRAVSRFLNKLVWGKRRAA